MLNSIFSVVMPHLLEVIGLVLTGVLGWMARQAKRRWDIEIEEKHLRTLHSALMTGARAAFTKDAHLSRERVAEEAIAYARESAPDAVAALKPKADVLVDLATARAKDALGWR